MAIFRHAQQQYSTIPDLDRINSRISNYLTNKEYEVLCQLCEGLTNKSIAEKLHVSINTIKTHIKNILSKLDVPNRSSAIAKIKAV